MKESKNKVVSINDKITNNFISGDDLTNEFSKLDSSLNKIEESNQQFENILKSVEALIRDDKFLKFIDSDKILELFKNINNLTFEQLIYVTHLSGSIVILISIISISTIVYSNAIIEYLQLETKYPKIAKFIQLRKKFQNYLLIMDLIIIFFVK